MESICTVSHENRSKKVIKMWLLPLLKQFSLERKLDVIRIEMWLKKQRNLYFCVCDICQYKKTTPNAVIDTILAHVLRGQERNNSK